MKMQGMGYSGNNRSKLVGFGTNSTNQESLGETVIENVKDILSKVSNFNKKTEKCFENIHPINQINTNCFLNNANLNSSVNTKHIPGVAGGGWSDNEEQISEFLNCNSNVEGNKGKEKSNIGDEIMLLDNYLETASPFSHFECDYLFQKLRSLDQIKVCSHLNLKLDSSEEIELLKVLMLIEAFIYYQYNINHLKEIFSEKLKYLSVQNGMPKVNIKSKKIIMIMEKS